MVEQTRLPGKQVLKAKSTAGFSQETTSGGKKNEKVSTSRFGVLMGLVRQQLYVPDGCCPTRIRTGTWSERRDASILKHLCQKYGISEVADAICGLAVLRDSGGLSWAKPHTKMTLRGIYHTNAGCEDLFHVARYTYRRSLHRPSRPLPSLGRLLYGQGL